MSLVNLDKFSFRLYDMDLSLSGASVLDKDRESITITHYRAGDHYTSKIKHFW